MDLLKENIFDGDFEIRLNPSFLKLIQNTVGTAEMIEVPNGALLIIKIPIYKDIVKDCVKIIKERCGR